MSDINANDINANDNNVEKCPDCKGSKTYQPLFGPPEPCQSCSNSTGIEPSKMNKSQVVTVQFDESSKVAITPAGLGPAGLKHFMDYKIQFPVWSWVGAQTLNNAIRNMRIEDEVRKKVKERDKEADKQRSETDWLYQKILCLTSNYTMGVDQRREACLKVAAMCITEVQILDSQGAPNG